MHGVQGDPTAALLGLVDITSYIKTVVTTTLTGKENPTRRPKDHSGAPQRTSTRSPKAGLDKPSTTSSGVSVFQSDFASALQSEVTSVETSDYAGPTFPHYDATHASDMASRTQEAPTHLIDAATTTYPLASGSTSSAYDLGIDLISSGPSIRSYRSDVLMGSLALGGLLRCVQ
jgi:hypothetical protein